VGCSRCAPHPDKCRTAISHLSPEQVQGALNGERPLSRRLVAANALVFGKSVRG